MPNYKGKRKYGKTPKKLAPFQIAPIPGCEGAFLYVPKIVGVSFASDIVKEKLDLSYVRTHFIKEFFKKYDSIFHVKDSAKNIIVDAVKSGDFSSFAKLADNVVVEREPFNRYDSNALCVKVKASITTMVTNHHFKGFTDIGYLPGGHSAEINKRFRDFRLVGVMPDGLGMKLQMVLTEYEIEKSELLGSVLKNPDKKILKSIPVEDDINEFLLKKKVINPKPMSLRKIRNFLGD